jgi:HK97 family phage major capsid protein
LAVLSGSGASGQPLGIDNVTGVGTVTGTSLAFEDILEFQTDVAAGNVMPSRGGYVTTPAVASLCIQRVKYTSTASPLWEGNIWNGTMQGFPAMSSNQVASAVMYFGDWSKIVIAEWGTLEIDTNPYGSGFGAGIIAVRALYSVDVGVRLPVAFSRASSIT